MKTICLLTGLLVLVFFTYGQKLNQNIRGSVTDESSGEPVPFATVTTKVSGHLLGTITDTSGKFELSGVPVGRYDIEVSCIGYEPVLMKEILVTSGKEYLLEVNIRESVVSLDEIQVKPTINKGRPLNSMAMVSARMLSVEEAKRYAGGFDDPARLASSFAGVAGNVGNNGIIIRGNAPQYMSWRLEGIEIPNPNHFADMSAFGAGGLTGLSSHLLANSDFFTGAFPAEYGNATSGVFDIFMRPGNNSQHEHTVQLGLIGIDVASEGPFKKEGQSSYIFNYRYSTLTLMTPLLPEDADGTNYQDLSFKLNFPTKKAGVFSVWGIGLADKSGTQPETDTLSWHYIQDKQTQDVKQFMAAGGLNHKFFPGVNKSLHSGIALNGSGLNLVTNEYLRIGQLHPKNRINNNYLNLVVTSKLNQKFSSRHTNQTGFIATLFNYGLAMGNAPVLSEPLQTNTNQSGNSWLLSFFSSSKFRVGQNFNMTCGIHTQNFTLNNNYSIEPRIAAQLQLRPNQSAGLAYGMHTRLERLNIYLLKNENGEMPNKNLGFMKSQHFVCNYNITVGAYTRIKMEPYYQRLTNIPVQPSSSFALINLKDDWFIDHELKNQGEGYNLGFDFTLERFIHNGFYSLLTASVFESKYKAGDGIWRNTRYNRNYLFNILGGKEWTIGNSKQNLLSINGRASFQGGDRIVPVDYAASEQANDVILDEERAFEEQLDPQLIMHITINYKINRKKYASTWSLNVLNATGVKEFYGFHRNLQTGTIDVNNESIIIPNISYKIEF